MNMDLLGPALVVGFCTALFKFLDWFCWTQLSRPIFCVAFEGLLLSLVTGDSSLATTGVLLAAQLELVFIGNVSMGGVMPSDYCLGSLFGGAFAMVLGQDIATAITLAVPLSMLGSVLFNVMEVGVCAIVPKFDELLDQHKLASYKALWWAQFAVYHLCWFLLGFVCILAGADAVGAFVNALPVWFTNGMSVAASMVPALGLALLLKSLYTKESMPWYFIGFGLMAFLTYNATTGATLGADKAITLATAPTSVMTLVEIAFFGFAVAAIIIFKDLKEIKERQAAPVLNAASDDEDEDFFND